MDVAKVQNATKPKLKNNKRSLLALTLNVCLMRTSDWLQSYFEQWPRAVNGYVMTTCSFLIRLSNQHE